MRVLFLKWKKIVYQAVINYLFLKGNTPIEDELGALYGDCAPSLTTMKIWASRFKRYSSSFVDDKRSGLPKIASTDDNFAKIHQMVLDERRIIQV
ncbi:HTH_48 domain-containing protein [Nephila pilipes]|uniref:HTH_48 domain-containing protein n=1 Tax=Nephila pilipes TaxID=299642 RepID=A0A8X6JQX8_NEPPI|nr:HTH_48 domain-containing protein [Nephila pilipes]